MTSSFLSTTSPTKFYQFTQILVWMCSCDQNLVISKNTFAYLFSVHNTIPLSHHEQVSLMRLCFKRVLSHHRARQIIMFPIIEGNMQTWKETIKLTEKKNLRNVTN